MNNIAAVSEIRTKKITTINGTPFGILITSSAILLFNKAQKIKDKIK